MDLKTELKNKADFFNKSLEKYLQQKDPKLLYEASRHLPMAGGKRLRPCISMVSCEAIGGEVEKALPLAASLEIVHNFTLVHDDIMDNSKLRRNLPAVHIKYGEPTAIMAGDLLFAKAFEALYDITSNLDDFKRVYMGLVKCVEEICEGQQLDMEFEDRKIISEDEYFNMIMKKTAVLFSFSAEGGAIVAGGSEEQINAMKEYGRLLGLGFQIWDDYLDISSDAETLGKDIGNDIRNGKKTLIAVHCLNNATGENKQILDEIFGNLNATDEDVKKVYNVFKNVGSVDYAKDTALKFNADAKTALSVLDDSHSKEILVALADYSVSREK